MALLSINIVEGIDQEYQKYRWNRTPSHAKQLLKQLLLTVTSGIGGVVAAIYIIA